MKTGRNENCPCGSGKKYKHCCMNDSFDNMTQMQNEIEQTIAMNPNLSIEELNVVAQHKMAQLNNQPNDDFCGISPVQMSNWMYAPWNELTEVNSTRQKI